MKKEQIKYVAVRPDGSICGPVGDNSRFIKQALIIGYARVNNLSDIRQENKLWKRVKKLGYSIRKMPNCINRLNREAT